MVASGKGLHGWMESTLCYVAVAMTKRTERSNDLNFFLARDQSIVLSRYHGCPCTTPTMHVSFYSRFLDTVFRHIGESLRPQTAVDDIKVWVHEIHVWWDGCVKRMALGSIGQCNWSLCEVLGGDFMQSK